MTVTTVGIDLAKNIFQIHGVDQHGKTILKKKLKRDQLFTFFANKEPCLIGMEACSGAHFWARVLANQGHHVKLMAPQFVKPYVKTNKNDAADAEAICEAVTRPNMRFVGIKSPDQQALLSLHRARSGLIKAQTAQINQVRGLLTEFGIIMPIGKAAVKRYLPLILEDADNSLPDTFRQVISRLYEHLKELEEHIEQYDHLLNEHFKHCELSQRIASLPGIGLISATAIVGTIGDASEFKNGRQLSAWLGLVPRQHSSGGKNTLLGISKRGDAYLRTLLIHGARSVLIARKNKVSSESWLGGLIHRRNTNVAAVALANKNARTLWAMLTRGEDYNPKQYPDAFAS
ncbi:IS110 family RNA-guided transposase [Vibrio echinoideorum]|uniref:IS110 family transposase n=1 Tax=Vibrio echinoideorum TaxID=2100116 RepID=UPI0035518ABE